MNFRGLRGMFVVPHAVKSCGAAAAMLLATASLAAAQVSPALTTKSGHAAEIISAAQQQGFARVMVLYSTPQSPAHANIGTAAENIQEVASANISAQNAIIESHLSAPPTFAGADRALQRMTVTPAFAVNATAAEINALAADPRVQAIEIDRIGRPQLLQAVPLIGMTATYALGGSGQGQAVAVMDTGVDTNHKFLAGQTIQEACFSTTQGTIGSGGSKSLCPNGASSGNGPGTALNCDVTWDGCEHGTHVAGISIGNNSELKSGQPANGAGKAAKLIFVKMYSQFSGGDCLPGSSPCVKFYASDFVRGLDYVYSIRNTLPGGIKIAAVNLSGGSGHFSPPNCDAGNQITKASIDNLRAAGIATFVSAGNGSSTSQIGFPACISSTISVASSTKSDAPSSFTDLSSQVTIFAPGGQFLPPDSNPILSSTPAGFNAASFGFSCGYSGPNPSSGGTYCGLQGTSMAAPIAAGAFAAIRSACPTATIDQIVGAMTSTGKVIADTRPGGTVSKPRIQVDSAIQALGCPVGSIAMLKNASSGTDLCLIFGDNGQQKNPERYDWSQGSTFCGFPGREEALLVNKQGVWHLVSLEGDKYMIKNASDGAEKCLIFGGNGQQKYPERYDWGHGNEFCGFPGGKDALLANKQAVWRVIPLDGNKVMIKNASDGAEKCLIFGGNGQQKYPERYDWGHGNEFCGFPGGKDALLANKQAVFELVKM
jgi:hypothetical protein